ncbi:MAG TPA: S-layer homology domain-containing protein [Bryobacteraceae bacterium]|nr:S-layer homology domain-containing protein [Bryobacteraceae bacterium]
MIRKSIHAPVLICTLILTSGGLSAQSPINFQDVTETGPESSFFPFIQVAANAGLALPAGIGPCVLALPPGSATPLVPPPGSGGSTSTQSGCAYFGPDALVTRAETAYWVVKSQMDETAISNYLCATGGDPTGTATQCNASIPAFTFGDMANIMNPFVQAGSTAAAALGVPGVSLAQLQRYIEVAARRGYTKGCGSTADTLNAFCPNDLVNRAQAAVLIIRAKMNNVFPTTLSGTAQPSPYGDNFGVPSTPYFTDVTPNDPVWGPYFIFVQAMRELEITSGTSPTTFSPGNTLTRKEIATFIVKAFFL